MIDRQPDGKIVDLKVFLQNMIEKSKYKKKNEIFEDSPLHECQTKFEKTYKESVKNLESKIERPKFLRINLKYHTIYIT